MITNVAIKSFKCLHDERLEFRPLTILTGKNSSGKSSVLQAILLLARNCNPQNYEQMYTLISKYQNIDCEISINHNGTLYTYNSTDNKIDPCDILKNEENLYYLSANRIGPEDIAKLSQDYKVGNHGEFLFGSLLRFFNDKYDYAVNDKMQDVFDELTLDILSLMLEHIIMKGGISSEDKNSFLGYLKEEKMIPEKAVNFLGRGYKLILWLSYIMDSCNCLIPEQITEDSVKIAFWQADGKEINPHNVGSGTSYLAKVLILSFLARPGDLVMIENPEIHLHPQAQSRLGEFFAFLATNGVQLVIETHCEHLLSSLRYQVYKKFLSPEHVILHYKENAETPFEKLLINENGHYTNQDGKRTSFPKGFFDASVYQLMEMG